MPPKAHRVQSPKKDPNPTPPSTTPSFYDLLPAEVVDNIHAKETAKEVASPSIQVCEHFIICWTTMNLFRP